MLLNDRRVMNLVQPVLLDIFECTFTLFFLKTRHLDVGELTAFCLRFKLVEVLRQLLDRLIVLNINNVAVAVINEENLHLALAHGLHDACAVPLAVRAELGGAESALHDWLDQVLGGGGVEASHQLVNFVVFSVLIEDTNVESAPVNCMGHLYGDLIEERVSLP